MTINARSNKRPWWVIFVLLIFGIVNFLIAEMIKGVGPLKPIDGMHIYAAYIIFGQISGLLVGLIIYLFYLGGRSYKNEGNAIDRSHIWVDAKSGRKVSDASIKAVYEKQHGYGSWAKKVKQEQGCVTVFAVIVAVILCIYGFYALSFRVRLPVLTATQQYIGSNLVYILSWLGLALVGGLAIFLLYLSFWDIAKYKPLDNDPPSPWSTIPKALILILVVLLNLAVLIFTFWPSLRSFPVGRYYSGCLFMTYLASGILWILGIFLQDVKESKEYRRQQELQNKKKAIEDSIEKFFGKDTEYKERLISGLVLLSYRDSLTYDGKKSVVDGLKIITGQNFDSDYTKWEEWIMKELMK